jgi:hypothetical protein
MASTASVNMMAGVKFTLLGTELNAGFEQTDSGKHIFVFQDLSTPNEGVTVDKLITDVKVLMGTTTDVPGLSKTELSNKLAVVAKSDTFHVDAIRIVLSTVYLDINIPNTGDSTVEYAFRLDVIATGLVPAEVKLINIDRVTIAVWNTTNEKIKKQLAISIDSAK